MTQRVVNTLFYGLILLVVFFSTPALAQVQDEDAIELYPLFRHRSVINTVMVSYYVNDTFYLPVGELFGLLRINYEPYINGEIILRGRYLEEQTPYEINLTKYEASIGNKRFMLKRDDVLIGELDYYLEIDVFKEIFDLDFEMDINSLSLTLQSIRTMPVVSSLLRAQKRERANYNRRADKNYDIRFDRRRSLINGGFVDYNLSNTYSNQKNLFAYSSAVGLEVLGGDVQGTILGSFSSDYNSFQTSNLRWRYMIKDRPLISRVELGQTSSDGILNTSYTGIRLTNDPVEPRRLFDEFRISGNTLPQSEVELYLNNSLIDFQNAGGLGNYNFLVPLTYGISKYDIRIYGPTGRIIENSRNIQVPFTFTPPGVVNYHLNAGQMNYRQIGTMNRDYMGNADISMGVTKWLSLDAGAEYYESFDQPTYRGAINTRLFSQYLFRGEYATDAYMKASANVVYANSTSFSASYTEFNGYSLYNLSNDDGQLLVNSFIPVRFLGIPLSFRANLFSRFRQSVDNHRVRLEAGLQQNRLNIRFAFLDNYSGKLEKFKPTNLARFQPSITYSLPRGGIIPGFLQGAFFRTQITYFPQAQQVESGELFIAKGLSERSRIQFIGNHNFIANVTSFGFNVVIDFNKMRTNASVRSLQSGTSFTQNLRGSFGYDPFTKQFLMSSREQVGRAATAVRLFVDNNGNGSFDDGDEPINVNAVRMDRAGATSATRNGITYYTQLQPYYKYNMDLIKSNIPNPMLVPAIDKFAMISDPNQYKLIDIPFFMSGVIEGNIQREIDGVSNPVGGLKLNLIKDGEILQELRTFSEGSFYAYEIPPGTYRLEIPNQQLALLSSQSTPEYHEFEVKAVREGDFIEGLNFTLTPRVEVDSTEIEGEAIGLIPVGEGIDAININYNIPVERLRADECRYGLQLGAYSTLDRANALMNDSPTGTPYVVLNERNNLYAIRTGQYQYLSDASKTVRDIESRIFPQISVISQCNTVPQNTFVPGGFAYHIQFGAFSNPSSAEQYSKRLNSQFNIDTFLLEDTERRLIKVLTGNYPDTRRANAGLQEVIRVTGIQDLFVTKQPQSSLRSVNARFDYRLELGEFNSNDDAALYAARINNNFGIVSKILIDEREVITLVTSHDFANWTEFLEFKAKLVPEEGYIEPVIQLIERRL